MLKMTKKVEKPLYIGYFSKFVQWPLFQKSHLFSDQTLGHAPPLNSIPGHHISSYLKLIMAILDLVCSNLSCTRSEEWYIIPGRYLTLKSRFYLKLSLPTFVVWGEDKKRVWNSFSSKISQKSYFITRSGKKSKFILNSVNLISVHVQ